MRANYTLHRLFVDQPLAAGARLALDKGHSNYLINVLRKKVGAPLLVFNGRDGEWSAAIDEISRRSAFLGIEEQQRPQPDPSELMFAFAPIKAGRLDYMVQKAVEMGAGTIQPVFTQNTQVNRINLARLKANAIEAAEQCGVLAIPTVNDPVKLDEFIAGWHPTRPLIFCDEDHATDNPLGLLAPLKGQPLALLTGPEGGFSDKERQMLRALPFVTAIPLGPRILRADTAAVAAMAIIQAAAGDW